MSYEPGCSIEDALIVDVGHDQSLIKRRLCDSPLLRPEPSSIDATSVIKGENEVHAPDYANRNAVGKLDEDLGHSHALTGRGRHRVVLRIEHQPFESRVRQPNKSAVLIQ